jgi:PPK2 family polyphosphate:nucleotide phosphotransferase
MSHQINTQKLEAATDGHFHLKDHHPGRTDGFRDKEDARGRLEKDIQEMAKLQGQLYAQDRYSVLLIFQAMDAAGKDGTIKHVMSGLNPQGCQVTSFKQPSSEELDHDYLWRVNGHLPARGQIGIFNRSYYEEVLVVRVHPEILARQKLPPECLGAHFWKRRFEQINHYEKYLHENGTIICKFFLHVSHKEQKKRFLERIEHPEKNWKFSAADVTERAHWNDYQRAYEEAIACTSTPHAPWYVIPADHKWFARLAVARVVVEILRRLHLQYPVVSKAQKRELQAARKRLMEERS